MRTKINLCEESKCTGCSACANICKKEAIIMLENEHGARVPHIDDKKCIQCGACECVCPEIHPLEKKENRLIYAAWSKNENVVKNSASAGAVTALAQSVLSKAGVVFGTCYKEGKLVFDYIESMELVDRFQGSKYIQADIGKSYQMVQAFLKEGRWVLFSGTPCQVAGLKSFLRKDYEKLLTVDLICHGIAPEIYLKEYMNKILQNGKYDKVLFRGAKGEKTVAYFNNQVVYEKNKLEDLFFFSYAKGLIHRENCYSCQYASRARVGDITAGDFWGIEKGSLKNDASKIPYVSLVLINSKKAQNWIEDMQEYLVLEERKIEEALERNRQLSEPCKKHEERDQFLDNYSKYGFVKAVKMTKLNKQVNKNCFYYGTLRRLKKMKDKIVSKRY